ncbi:phosphoribosylaminoimidazole-succinocarboxamide synthase [Colletotrichum higginsianum]|nr:phosphoribosylaminoimidazole-succinocarboxamide synthase [Colletotrichum higginsianum]
MKELALIRYNSAWSVANPVSVYVHFSLAFLLMILFILGVSITPELTPHRSYCWEPSGLSRSHANLILDVVLTSVVGVLSDFWASLSIFVAHTEPLAQMASPKGGPAKHTLLLNYTSSFLPVKIYDAFRNKHWKLVRVVIWELIQRSFPTLVGNSIVVYSRYPGESGDSCVICFSMPLFIVIIVGLAACAGSIVYELLLASVFRRTPRDYLSIADIVSWSSTSSLLHPAATENAQRESPLADPLHVEVEGEKSKRWYMQHRLELQLSRFRLGYAKVPDREYYAFGITDEEPERLPAVRPTHLARRLEVVESELGEEEGIAKGLEIVVGNGSISYDKLVSASEDTMVTHDDGNIFNHPHQNEEEQPEEGN